MPEVELRLSDGQMYGHKGKIDAISGTTDTETGAITLRAVFPNPERMLRNGSTATLIFPYVKKDVFVIPQEATFEIQDKVYVYKVNKEGKAESAQVTVFSQNNGTEYVVESGLQQGENDCCRRSRTDSGKYAGDGCFTGKRVRKGGDYETEDIYRPSHLVVCDFCAHPDAGNHWTE